MPLIYTSDLITVGKLGVWKVEEEDAFFHNQLHVTDIEQEELDYLGIRKRKEWFSSRYLLHLLSEREIRGACLKDAFGKLGQWIFDKVIGPIGRFFKAAATEYSKDFQPTGKSSQRTSPLTQRCP